MKELKHQEKKKGKTHKKEHTEKYMTNMIHLATLKLYFFSSKAFHLQSMLTLCFLKDISNVSKSLGWFYKKIHII